MAEALPRSLPRSLLVRVLAKINCAAPEERIKMRPNGITMEGRERAGEAQGRDIYICKFQVCRQSLSRWESVLVSSVSKASWVQCIEVWLGVFLDWVADAHAPDDVGEMLLLLLLLSLLLLDVWRFASLLMLLLWSSSCSCYCRLVFLWNKRRGDVHSLFALCEVLIDRSESSRSGVSWSLRADRGVSTMATCAATDCDSDARHCWSLWTIGTL